MLMSLGIVESTVQSCQEAGTALLHIPSGFPGISGHFCEHSHFFTSPTPTCLFSARLHSPHNSLLPTRVLGRQSTSCVYTSLNPDTDSSGGNKHVGGFSHTCVENGKHLQTYNCVAFFTHVCLFPYICVKIQTCVENST